MRADLLGGRRLAVNTVWHLGGAGLPLLVAVWAIPELLHSIGRERFGVLTVIWMAIGYLGLFDLGIGRALTKLCADRLGQGRDVEVPILVRTGLQLMLALGMVAALLIALAAHWLSHRALGVSLPLQDETEKSLQVLAVAIPFVIHSAGLVGVLQAYQRAPAINIVRLPLGLLNFLGPVAAAHFSPSLTTVTLTLAAARALSWIAYWLIVKSVVGPVPYRRRFDGTLAKDLLGFGGWVTVSGVISPLMVSFDRLLIGSIVSMAMIAFYTVPQEIISRLSIVPAALSAVIFPALTTALWSSARRAEELFDVAAQVSASVMLMPITVIVLFSAEGLSLWLGSSFAAHSAAVFRIIAVGMFVNTMAQLPYHALHARGAPDLAAKLHLCELPVYLLVLWMLAERHGIVGAAVAWTIRALADTVLLYGLAWLRLPELRIQMSAAVRLTAVLALMLALLCLLAGIWLKLAAAIVIVGMCALFALRALRRLLSDTGIVNEPAS